MTIRRLIYLILVFGLVLTSTSLAKASKKQQSDIRFRPRNRNKIHDISIIQIRVEPTQFKIGDHVRVLVSVANRGKASVNDVSLELKIRNMPIGHRNITTIAPGQIVEAGFTCIIGRRKSELIEIAATIKPIEIEKIPREKIKKVRYNCVYNAEDDIGILYKVEPPVHQWIAFQAYNKLPAGSLKSEMSAYLPTSSSSWYYSSSFDPVTAGWTDDPDAPYNDLRALIEGTWEEDKPDWLLRWMNHYWNPDGGYNDGLYIGFKTALQKAQEDLWQDAISAYNNDQTAQAYYLLGRIAHLLMDMSVPAHTLLDEHPIEDRYEEFTGDNYKNITSSSPNTGIPSGLPSYPQYTPPSYNDNLTKLFYNLAEKSDDFDSDDEDGESTDYGKGKYTWGRNALDASKTFSRAEYFVWTLLSGWEKERDLVRYVDYDIFRSCINSNEYHIYYYRSFYDEYNNTLTHWVKVYYTDGSSEFVDWDLEELGDVTDSVLECIHQKQLQARAVGYVAALYQLFWDSVEHPDTDPPTPSPMTWATEPYQTSTSSISMVATVASDPSTPIYYEFDFFTSPSGGSGGTDSGWQTSTSYTDSGLEPNHRYSYQVRAKDSATTPNVTAYSIFSDEYTDIETPSGITFGTITTASIQAKSSSTPSGLTRGSSGLIVYNTTRGTNSGWKQNNDYWTSDSLSVNTQNWFTAKARNGDGEETPDSPASYRYTYANPPGSASFSNVNCTIIQANWTADGNPSGTEYYCENITTGQNSGWVNNTYSWNSTGLSSATPYSFQVKARNGDEVDTAWTNLGSEATHYVPVIISIMPSSGPESTCMTIEGQYFYDSGSVVFPGGITAEILQWTNTVIYCRVPENSVSGNIIVNRGLDSNPLWFTVTDPNIIYVDINHTPNVENGTTQYPFGKIQYGIDAATTDDEVIIADGTYTGDGNRDIDFWGKAITVRSKNGPQTCIIDCQNQGRGFYFHSHESNNSILDGFTITNGSAGNCDGGGISCYDSSPIIKNSVIKGNRAQAGAGIAIWDASPKLISCVISDNIAEGYLGGGGILILCSGDRSLTFRNCIISNNVASNYDGGGLYCGGNNLMISLTNCTISNNSAADFAKGGGVGTEGDTLLTITNSILWGNTSSDYSQLHPTTTPIVTFSDVQGGWPGTGNINLAPLFIDPYNGDYHLLPNSPCIDAGDPNYPEDANEVDIDGDARIIGGRIDMGADEYRYGELCDLYKDGIVNFKDFSILAYYWMDYICLEPDWCEGSDFDESETVGPNDLRRFAENWLWQAQL